MKPGHFTRNAVKHARKNTNMHKATIRQWIFGYHCQAEVLLGQIKIIVGFTFPIDLSKI